MPFVSCWGRFQSAVADTLPPLRRISMSNGRSAGNLSPLGRKRWMNNRVLHRRGHIRLLACCCEIRTAAPRYDQKHMLAGGGWLPRVRGPQPPRPPASLSVKDKNGPPGRKIVPSVVVPASLEIRSCTIMPLVRPITTSNSSEYQEFLETTCFRLVFSIQEYHFPLRRHKHWKSEVYERKPVDRTRVNLQLPGRRPEARAIPRVPGKWSCAGTYSSGTS